MFDLTTLSAKEVLDYCRALSFTIVKPDNTFARELLTDVLCERLNPLNEKMKAGGKP